MQSIFNLINVPFSYVIRFFNGITGSYMLALFGFALVVKIVLFPLGIKQQKNMVKQATLRPKEMAIRAKYAGRTDKATQQKMQNEIMELYQRENYNPAGGCLPMILQLVVVWAIYRIVYGPLTYLCAMDAEALNAVRMAVAALQDTAGTAIENLKAFSGNEIQLLSIVNDTTSQGIGGVSAVIEKLRELYASNPEYVEEATRVLVDNPPNMTVFGMNLAVAPSKDFPSWLLIVPALNLLTTWCSTKITRKLSYQAPSQQEGQAASSMKLMEITMPLMITFMAYTLPAALGIYWVFQNILGVLQQFILSKMYPYPVFTEEDLKAAERELKGKKNKPKAKTPRDPSLPPVRSLHHIDDEDYETTVTTSTGTRYDRDDEEESTSPIAKAPMKDDK